MKLNRKLWTAALAVAMTTPSAMAAQDTAGMHYTSAAEGFYASIRLRYVSNGGDKDGAADIENGSSRFGVRGTNDLGSGLEGFYQYEMGVGTENGNKDMSTRVAHVGLRGDFGSFVAGAFWPDSYNFVYGSTDVANRHSGYMTGPFGQYRTSKSLQYTTPDMNGFKAAILIKADSSSDGQGAVSKPTDNLVLSVRDVVTISTNVTVTREVINVSTSKVKVDDESGHSYEPYYVNSRDWGTSNVGGTVRTTVRVSTIESEPVQGNKDDNDIDHWNISAKYEIAGFSTGVSFSRNADSIKGASGRDDGNAWAAKLGYSQDNWYVNGWYGEAEADHGLSDTEVASIAGGISVDKVSLYALYEVTESGKMMGGAEKRMDDARSTLGVQYTLGSNSWTWVEYAGRDLDSSESEDSDFSIGLGHSF